MARIPGIINEYYFNAKMCTLHSLQWRQVTLLFASILFSAIAGKGYMLTILDGLVTVLASSLSYYFYLKTRTSSRSTPLTKASTEAQGFIVLNTVSHARFLPKPSSHAFVYPTLTFFLNVYALETKRLNLGFGHGFLFGSGKRSWSRIANIRPTAYLIDDGVEEKGLGERFEEFVKQRALEIPKKDLSDVWLLTSPSYLGFEGINPLSVWFCYGEDRRLNLVLLEVHNTFGERHVYVLRTGVDEDQNKAASVDHQWTFPRQFHVSPFNDRSGYYVCAISGSAHPHSTGSTLPLPTIRLNLLTPERDLKLTAITRASTSNPLTISSFFTTLLHHPFILFLSLIRISYQAAKLHYFKRLDVYPRPDPVAPDSTVENTLGQGSNPFQDGKASGTAVGWQSEAWIHRRSRLRIYRFLEERVKEMNVTIELIPSNPVEIRRTYASDRSTVTLSIHYRSPLFFVFMFVLPSATHSLLLGSKAERIFTVSDEELFLEVFEPRARTRSSGTQKLRKWCLPTSFPPRNLSSPPVNALDNEKMWDVEAMLVIVGYYGMEWFETALYRLFRARFVPGEEPWNGWKRLRRGEVTERTGIGSVRRETL